jgi:hypothetical protein
MLHTLWLHGFIFLHGYDVSTNLFLEVEDRPLKNLCFIHNSSHSLAIVRRCINTKTVVLIRATSRRFIPEVRKWLPFVNVWISCYFKEINDWCKTRLTSIIQKMPLFKSHCICFSKAKYAYDIILHVYLWACVSYFLITLHTFKHFINVTYSNVVPTSPS